MVGMGSWIWDPRLLQKRKEKPNLFQSRQTSHLGLLYFHQQWFLHWFGFSHWYGFIAAVHYSLHWCTWDLVLFWFLVWHSMWQLARSKESHDWSAIARIVILSEIDALSLQQRERRIQDWSDELQLGVAYFRSRLQRDILDLLYLTWSLL